MSVVQFPARKPVAPQAPKGEPSDLVVLAYRMAAVGMPFYCLGRQDARPTNGS